MAVTAISMKARGKPGRGVSWAPGMEAEVPPTLLRWELSLGPMAHRDPTRRLGARQPPTRPPQRKGHTAVRTDDDSGFDTLWLLKKMDSRSEKAKEGATVRSSRQGRRLHHLTPGGSTSPATGNGGLRLSIQRQPHGAPASWAPPSPKETLHHGWTHARSGFLFQLFFPYKNNRFNELTLLPSQRITSGFPHS